MTYEVITPKAVKKQLLDLPDEIILRLFEKIESLSANPRPDGVKKLKGRDGYRVRVGSYRIIYTIDDKAKTLTLIDIGDRKDIYR